MAIASAIAIVVYVLLLGWLQFRRFSREAAARGDSLDRVYGMLDPALRMGFACGAAIGAGFLIRLLLPQFLLGMGFVGLGFYLIIARLLGIHELAEVQELIRRKLTHRELLPNKRGQ